MPQSSGEQLLARGEAAYAEGEYEAARKLFEEAEALGVSEALHYLGIIYQDGDGVAADEELAKTYLQRFIRVIREKAVDGDPAYQLKLGKMLQFGDQVLKDEQEALKWIRAAADEGFPPAQFHLSCLYAYGWCSLEPDSEQRQMWLGKAAERGFPEAIYQKGVIYLNQFLATEDLKARKMATMWLERAKVSGYEEAEAALQQLMRGA
jgi:uncharacterized protein